MAENRRVYDKRPKMMDSQSVSHIDQYTLETPENIEVHFELAGIGSRFCAILIDTILMSCCILILVILFAVTLSWSPTLHGSDSKWPEWAGALLVVIGMTLLTDGYFMFFEWIMRGQTPGKKSMKLRVINDDGTAVTGTGVLVRNILRIVDFLPAAYGVGLVAMFTNRHCKRLGDMAAGTIVIKEGQLDYRANADKKKETLPDLAISVNSELTHEERRLLCGFIQRREQLLLHVRLKLARQLALPLVEKYGGNADDPEKYLERLLEGRHHEL